MRRAAALERLVANGQNLIDHQEIGRLGYGQGIRQPEAHSGRIRAHRLIGELAEASKLDGVLGELPPSL
jgi:hypothetical protein